MKLRGLLFDPSKSFGTSRKSSVGVHFISAYAADFDDPSYIVVFHDTALRVRNPLPLKIKITVLFKLHSPRPSYVTKSCFYAEGFSPVEHHYYDTSVAQ